jgi:diguanylate cyclase (GGDEF)-like protein/PAS domain S-box-containing protein
MKNYVFTYSHKHALASYCEAEKITAHSGSLLIQVFTALNERAAIQELLDTLNSLFPHAVIIGSTTDGEIADGKVHTGKTILNFSLFDHTRLTCGAFDTRDSYQNGKELATSLLEEETRLFIVFADGLQTNGEKLLDGISHIDPSLKVAGGMAGDYASFTQTFVFTKDRILSNGAVAVSLNGKRLRIFNDYNYHWQKIGKELTITKCQDNRVYEINGKSAVETYKEYLGEPVAERLPAIGIEFPLIHYRDGIDIARAVLAKHEDGSLSFAGSMYEGEPVYFGYGDTGEIMKNAHTIPEKMASFAPEAIFAYSCMARRHFIGPTIEQELAPLQTLASMSGFFTYGEFFFYGRNRLLNQTLTVVGITEADPLPRQAPLREHTQKDKKDTYNSVNALIHLINRTSQEMMEQKVFSETNTRFEQLFEYSGDGIVVLKGNRLIACNQKMLTLFRCKVNKEAFLQQPLERLFAHNKNPNTVEEIIHQMQKKDSNHYLFEAECLTREKTPFWAEVMFTKIVTESETLLYAVFRDISQRKEMELEFKNQRDMLYYKAYHDDLTGLPNRKSMMQHIEEEIEHAARNRQTFALLFLDLDKLKIINDSLGHSIGDKLIALIAKRIKKVIGTQHKIARLGGDEFLILLKNINQKAITSQTEKILGSIREEIIFDMHHLYTTASIGIAEFPQDADDAQTLLKYADSAMYAAKEKGADQYQFYSKELTQKAHEQMKIAKAFRRAIRNREFAVYYQPQIEIQSGRLVGVEALIRWNHPEDGLISPISFLDAIEKANLLERLDKWVMNHAMKDMILWYEEGLNPGKLALNISMTQLESDRWEKRLMKIISRLRFNPKWLELEITETEIMKHPENAIKRLNILKNGNISIAIDDFGTGYSSLAQLKHLPFNKLKIDKVFVDDLLYNDDATIMFDTIIALAQNMDIPVLAEGIETKAQVEYLLAAGCQYVQGYYYARPMSAKNLRQYLIKQKKAV